MATKGLSNLSLNNIKQLADVFDLLALYDQEDKLASEPKSSAPGDLGPDSN